MPTATDANQAGATSESATLAAIIVELDGPLFDVRAPLCDAATAALRKAGSSLKPGQFAQYGLHSHPVAVARGLIEGLDVADLSAEDLAAVLSQKVESFLQKDAEPSAGLEKLLKVAGQRGIPVAVLTALPEALARAAMDRVGLSSARLFAYDTEDSSGFPRADIWLRVAKGMGKAARFCVAVTSSQVSAKSALSSGMRCIVVPDAFTSCHDFSGADVVLDSWDDMSAAEMLDIVAPMVR